MDTYEASKVRNVILVGHGGAGKTSLSEALLHVSGAITRMGRVEDGNTVTDFDPEEVKKQISVSTGLAPVIWRGVKINVLDAPGYADFVGEVRAALRAADACLFVVSAVDGVQVQHEVVWEMAVEAGLPRAFFINKMDRERASFQRTVEALIDTFGTQVAPLQFPIGEEHDFEGVADLLSRKAYRYDGGGRGAEGDWPDDIAGKAEPYREKLTEAVAEADDALLEKYLEEGELPEQDVVAGVKAGLAQAKFAPVLCGAAAKGMGADLLAELIVEAFPSPLERPPVKVMDAEGRETERPTDPSGPLTAFVFKTMADPYVGRISLFRVYSGRLRPDGTAHNATQGTDERVGQLFTLRGKEHESVSEVPAGDIGAVAKLTHTHTGDTLCAKDDPVTVPAVEWPEPLYAVAVEPKTTGDEDKLSTAMQRLQEEDPSFRVERQADTHQTVMYGLGEAHIDVMVERMKRKFGVEVTTHPARVPYKETLRTKVAALGRHVKQSGGHGQYGICHIEVEPLERGGGFEFVNKIVGGAIPSQYIPSVEKGIVKAMETGTTGHRMVDIKVTLFDGKFHTVDSSDMAFQIAGSLAIKDAVQKAGVVLLEPVVDVEITVPESQTGDVIGDLNAKRGRVLGMDPLGHGKTMIRAQVPQSEMTRYSIDLRSITGGRGLFTMKFSHYEEVPAHLADKIIAEAQREKEEAHK
ncbi:MAG: elongation factor G [Actinomycetota bacterium]|nr:elongation factor G [Actinomycetota bacterium]